MYDAHAWGREYPRVPNDLKMSLTISDPESKELFESTEALFRVESPFFSYFSMSMDRYYTPGIREIQLILTTNSERGVRFEVAIRKAMSGPVLAAAQVPLTAIHKDHVVSFDIADWNPGRYLATADLQSEAGKSVHAMHCIFIKKHILPARLPSSDPDISIRSDGIILLDEEPFCPCFVGGAASRSPLFRDCFNVNFGGLGAISRPLERLGIGLPDWTREKGELFRLLPEQGKLREHVRAVVTASKSSVLVHGL